MAWLRISWEIWFLLVCFYREKIKSDGKKHLLSIRPWLMSWEREKKKQSVRDSNGEVNKNMIWELKRNTMQMVYHPSKYLHYFPVWIHWFDLRNVFCLIYAVLFLRDSLTMHLILWIKLHLHIQRLGLQATEAFTVCRKAKALHVRGQFLARSIFISKGEICLPG